MRYDSPVTELVESATQGVESAWLEIIERYSSLVCSVCRRYGIIGADAEDVSANVWLRMVRGLTTIREPEALPGWLTTTTRHECLTLLRSARRHIPAGTELTTDLGPGADDGILVEERRVAVHRALRQLPDRDRRLLSMLFADPPASYAEISSTLGIPIGAIGPTRQRCLARVRRTPSIAALLLEERHHSPHLCRGPVEQKARRSA
jgi:RNA polymerase sigma factor (sigma-70 family)